MPDTGTGNGLWFSTSSTTNTITSSGTDFTLCTCSSTASTTDVTTVAVWRYVNRWPDGQRMQTPLPPPQRRIPDAERPEQLREASIVAARELLIAHLNHSQRRQFLRDRSFVVRGSDTGRRYRIRGPGYAHNIDWLDGERGDRVFRRFCAHADGHLMPWPDHLLAQKLNLEHAEREFLARANEIPVHLYG